MTSITEEQEWMEMLMKYLSQIWDQMNKRFFNRLPSTKKTTFPIQIVYLRIDIHGSSISVWLKSSNIFCDRMDITGSYLTPSIMLLLLLPNQNDFLKVRLEGFFQHWPLQMLKQLSGTALSKCTNRNKIWTVKISLTSTAYSFTSTPQKNGTTSNLSKWRNQNSCLRNAWQCRWIRLR